MSVRLTLHTVAIREDGCFSVLLWDGRPFCVSVERTFDGNAVVIPAGVTQCKRTTRFEGNPPYETFEVAVPGHSRILFHKGNVEDDSEGCVICGESFGFINGKTAVMDSKDAHAALMRLADGLDAFDLEVVGR